MVSGCPCRGRTQVVTSAYAVFTVGLLVGLPLLLFICSWLEDRITPPELDVAVTPTAASPAPQAYAQTLRISAERAVAAAPTPMLDNAA